MAACFLWDLRKHASIERFGPRQALCCIPFCVSRVLFKNTMFSFPSSNKKTDATPPVSPAAPPTPPHPLDALTGGAFSAPTSGERSARIREWLATQPAAEQLQEVFKELSARDKGAARAVRERLDEIRRASVQQAKAAEWASKAENLLALPKLNIADALAWQRDAAKAGAPLSREPLAALKVQLAARIKTIEDLQHRVQVQREVAVLLAQRIEVLSTKPWREAQAALEGLSADVLRWRSQAEEITEDAAWPSVEARFPSQLDTAQTQLQVVWEAFQSALAQTVAAAEDASVTLPPVPVWADELRLARGQPAEAAAAAPVKPKIDPRQQEQAMQAVGKALATLEQETAEGHGKASVGAAAALRGVLKVHGHLIDNALEARVHAALVAAGELQGWQRWSADQVREDLLARAQGLLQRPEGQGLGGRKMQETLRHLREQWKQTDQSAPANHGLWKRFDDTCNAAYKAVVAPWLEKVRSETAEHRTQRQALIDEVKAWTEAHLTAADAPDWKAVSRQLFQFMDRWRASGHVGEKVFAELQPLWRQAITAASGPLEAAQKASVLRRQAMIEEATALGAQAPLPMDAIRALQQRWQVEAQSVPIERKQEQRLWDAFRRPLDEAFQRKTVQRDNAAAQLNARDRAVLDAAKALEAANASADAGQIRAAMAALEAALRGQAEAAPAAAEAAPVQDSASTAEPAAAVANQEPTVADPDTAADGVADSVTTSEAAAPDTPSAEVAAPAPAPAPAPRRVVAVRGDDRPGMKKEATAPAGRVAGRDARRDTRRDARTGSERGNERGSERGPRQERSGDRLGEREARPPRLGDAAFRAQRDALEQAQATLRKLAAQAHGEVLTQFMAAWQQRDAAQVPSVQALGRAVSAAARNAWIEALAAPAKAAKEASQALLRLEMAAEVPTPAEHLDARRALQLQLLTRRGDPTPQQTWTQDTAQVLAAACDEASTKRLHNVLKVLLRRAQRS